MFVTTYWFSVVFSKPKGIVLMSKQENWDLSKFKIAVLIPCYNEEIAVPMVIRDFRNELPEADIYVFDNNSTDRTMEVAREAGAIVRSESEKGKGNVVRRMFADVEADIYILVDGDDTYHSPSVKTMIELLLNDHIDMVVWTRKEEVSVNDAYPKGHSWGNKGFNFLFQQFI